MLTDMRIGFKQLVMTILHSESMDTEWICLYVDGFIELFLPEILSTFRFVFGIGKHPRRSQTRTKPETDRISTLELLNYQTQLRL